MYMVMCGDYLAVHTVIRPPCGADAPLQFEQAECGMNLFEA